MQIIIPNILKNPGGMEAEKEIFRVCLGGSVG